jgi:hypothetical protein
MVNIMAKIGKTRKFPEYEDFFETLQAFRIKKRN